MPATLAADKPRLRLRRWALSSLALLTGIEEMTARLSFKERLTDAQIVRFCQRNPVLRVEQAADGDLLIMPPCHSETG